VELDGDEMTRIISKLAEDKLTLGHMDIDLKYYDLGIGCRHKTDDRLMPSASAAPV
jgi:isocitrate dehydrogenase